MKPQLAGLVLALVLALGAAAPAASQEWWPAYGNYGYGTGFDYNRNPYSYPRATYAQGPSLPVDDSALYGGYMPNAYYTGSGYARDRAMVFPSGRAYCQSAGSYLYCADITSGGGQLMSLRDQTEAVRSSLDFSWLGMRNNSVYGGVLATRTVGDQTQFTGTLISPQGESVNVDCTGPARTTGINLTCR